MQLVVWAFVGAWLVFGFGYALCVALGAYTMHLAWRMEHA